MCDGVVPRGYRPNYYITHRQQLDDDPLAPSCLQAGHHLVQVCMWGLGNEHLANKHISTTFENVKNASASSCSSRYLNLLHCDHHYAPRRVVVQQIVLKVFSALCINLNFKFPSACTV